MQSVVRVGVIGLLLVILFTILLLADLSMFARLLLMVGIMLRTLIVLGLILLGLIIFAPVLIAMISLGFMRKMLVVYMIRPCPSFRLQL